MKRREFIKAGIVSGLALTGLKSLLVSIPEAVIEPVSSPVMESKSEVTLNANLKNTSSKKYIRWEMGFNPPEVVLLHADDPAGPWSVVPS